ncbi:hypothetical protein BME99_09025 [Pseudomonas protegens]|nr:hypothetical protein BME99_09025 [Pseudomonas protegens]
MVHGGHTVGQDAAADHEHRRRTDHRQALHHQRRCPQDRPTDAFGQGGGLVHQPQPQVIELDDAGHQAVDTDGHDNGDTREHHHLLGQGGPGHGAQGDGDDFRGKDEIGAHRTLDLVLLESHQIHLGVGQGLQGLGMFGRHFGVVQVFVRQLLEALETQVGATQHQQRGHQPRRQGADGQRRRHQDQLVAKRPLGHRPDHRDFPLGADPGDLLGIEREVVAQHTGGLLRRHLGHQGHVIEYRGDVIDQYQQTASGHEPGFPAWK